LHNGRVGVFALWGVGVLGPYGMGRRKVSNAPPLGLG
jgi:hypothetical protein